MNTLIDWMTYAARTAFGIFAIVTFCVTVALALAWALVMGKPSPLRKEEDSE